MVGLTKLKAAKAQISRRSTAVRLRHRHLGDRGVHLDLEGLDKKPGRSQRKPFRKSRTRAFV
jgi:hypothetical protein